ncbi:MAG: HAMP domain-containing histidine kinase, partial [Thermoleophilaceae bacterium]|nr:HAMP domain-containing histidine kinase [Thermoleophilaceae bacterium]
LYALGAEPGGPLFLLLFLAADCAAVSLPLRAAVLYTGAAAAIAAITDVVLLMWSPTGGDIRLLVVRLAMLGLVTVGMAILTRRLAMEQEAARSVRDVNERLLIAGLREQEAAQAGRLEAERLETLDRLRADFIATVSHDLRTPLTAARAGLAMLDMRAAGQLGDDDRELLDTSRRNVEYLNILIGDLLTFNQLEAGVLRLEREPLDLRAVITAALRVVHPLLREKAQTLEIDLPGPLPCTGDMRRLEQVLINLLANAHRHTPAGSRITITGQAAASEARLTVSDDGPGIPLEEQEAIFRRFHRLSVAGEGSGLGLAIARRIVELHGGQLAVESAPGAGTRFHITLPTAAAGGTP